MKCICGEKLTTEAEYQRHIFSCDKISEKLLRVLDRNFEWLKERTLTISDIQFIKEKLETTGFYDETDETLKKAKEDGIVPPNCRLRGDILQIPLSENADPCIGCKCPRQTCGGRPGKAIIM